MTPTTLAEALALLDPVQPGCVREWCVGRLSVHAILSDGWTVATVLGDTQQGSAGLTRDEAARALLGIAKRSRHPWTEVERRPAPAVDRDGNQWGPGADCGRPLDLAGVTCGA